MEPAGFYQNAPPDLSMPSFIVVVNSKSGSALDPEQWKTFADPEQFPVWIKLDDVDDIVAAINQQRPSGQRCRILAAGGDGTIHAVAQHQIQADATCEYAVIPVGSGNDLARSLAMPLNPVAAWAVATLGPVHWIDVIECTWDDGHCLATNMVTIGNTGAFLRDLTPEVKQRWGPFCYLRGVVDVAVNLQTFHADIALDGGKPEHREFLNCFIANGRTSGGGLTVAPGAKLDDGLAEVVLIRDGESPEIAGLVGQYAVGDFLAHHLVESRQAREIRIESAEELPCTVDGEVFTTRTLQLKVRPRSFAMVAPVLGPAQERGVAAS